MKCTGMAFAAIMMMTALPIAAQQEQQWPTKSADVVSRLLAHPDGEVRQLAYTITEFEAAPCTSENLIVHYAWPDAWYLSCEDCAHISMRDLGERWDSMALRLEEEMRARGNQGSNAWMEMFKLMNGLDLEGC